MQGQRAEAQPVKGDAACVASLLFIVAGMGPGDRTASASRSDTPSHHTVVGRLSAPAASSRLGGTANYNGMGRQGMMPPDASSMNNPGWWTVTDALTDGGIGGR